MFEAIGRRLEKAVRARPHRAVGRVLRGGPFRRPALSVVVPVFNVEAYLRECLDSVMGQSLRDLEIIVVDDGSTDGSPAIIAEFASRDRRVRAFRQDNAGQGPARNLGVSHARGEFLAFLDADDLVPDGAYAFMVESLRRTGSDFSVGAARRFERGEYVNPSWNAVVHDRDRIGITIDEFPAALADVIACNRTFRRAFWNDSVGGFPAGILYEDHVPMVTAFLRAGRFDLLKRATYTWRIRDDRTSTGQQKHELRNLTDRVEVKRQAQALVDREASEGVRAAWNGRVIDTDFAAYIDHALRSDDEYRGILRDAVATYLALAGPEAMGHVRVRQKVRSHLASRGEWEQLEVAQRFFTEHGTVPPTAIVDGRVRIGDELPGLLSVELPPEMLELSRTESRLQACGLHAEWIGPSSLRLTGWVIIRGIALDRRSFERELWLEDADGGANIGLEVEPLSLPEATDWVNWANGSFDSCGFGVVIDTSGLASDSMTRDWRLRLRISVDGVTREGSLQHAAVGSSAGRGALTSQRMRDGGTIAVPRYDPEHGLTITIRRPSTVTHWLEAVRGAPRRLAPVITGRPLIEATAVEVVDDEITVCVSAVARWWPLLASARLTTDGEEASLISHDRVDDRTWRLVLPTTLAPAGSSGRGLRTGSYALAVTDQHGAVHRVTVAPQLVGALPISYLTSRHRARAIVVGRRELRIELEAPLRDDERSAFAQRELREEYRHTDARAEEAVLFHDPEERAGPALADIHERLRREDPALPLWWGVTDTSVDIPEGGSAIVIGSRDWYRRLAAASSVVAASDIGPFVRRRPHQRFLLVVEPDQLDEIGRSAWWHQGLTPGQIEHEVARYGATWSMIGVRHAPDMERVRRELDFPGDVVAGTAGELAEVVLRPR